MSRRGSLAHRAHRRRALVERFAAPLAAVIIAIIAPSAGCLPEEEAGSAPGETASGAGESSRPGGGSARAEEDFACRFTDITEAAGIDFRHVTGGYGEKLMPETLGSGAAFLDFDGDGRLDIFLVNGAWWPGHVPSGAPSPRCALYRGDGTGRFSDVTDATGAGISLYGMGCAVADHDGDGDDDIYVTAVGDNVLLENTGGAFRDATAAAGVAGGRRRDRAGALHPEWSTAALWSDFDRDGDLDLFVAGYIAWTPETEIFTTLDGIHKAFTTPDRYPGLACRFFRNVGDGRYRDDSEPMGLSGETGKALGAALWDFDRDGFLDIVVANDTRPNFFFLNRGGARFEEAGLEKGIAYDENGRARAGMGIDVADYANDGVPGVAIGNFSHEPVSLYRYGGDGLFATAAERAGLADATFRPLTFGLLFRDLDLDGALDLVLVNGHLEPEIARHDPAQTYPQGAQLFRGRGDGTFTDVSARAGEDFQAPRVARGLAAGDIDGDGDLDLLITVNGGAPALLRNDLRAGNHYLRVRLAAGGGNRRAIGAEVELTAGGRTQRRLVRTGSSYLSESEPVPTFGLGPSRDVERLVVRWPDGVKTTHAVEGVDRTLDVRR